MKKLGMTAVGLIMEMLFAAATMAMGFLIAVLIFGV